MLGSEFWHQKGGIQEFKVHLDLSDVCIHDKRTVFFSVYMQFINKQR